MVEEIVRPNGKVYRRRKPIRVDYYEHGDDGTGFVVLGTHNVFYAALLAGANLADFEIDPRRAEVTWWKLVPWDTTGHGFDSSWTYDPKTGTPCVVFPPEHIPW